MALETISIDTIAQSLYLFSLLQQDIQPGYLNMESDHVASLIKHYWSFFSFIQTESPKSHHGSQDIVLPNSSFPLLICSQSHNHSQNSRHLDTLKYNHIFAFGLWPDCSVP